ncbi:hypothetical protein [Aliarcobacter butzleri]|uniref:hypothetical protein n=1 Tax=Aliarcobacter butzleri TaxID=28197 RepID=UPI00125FC4B1|nr:hypothetical protein [Aliarcobacter butzleri]MDK2047669.1 hypothetical protein [Aliarcobacter butzleri]
MKIEVISKKDKTQNDNSIERSFDKVLRYGFSEKSNMSTVAKIALNASVSKKYGTKNINNSISNSDIVDFREINQKIINNLEKSNSLINLQKGARVVG